jgi:hypothetical protein
MNQGFYGFTPASTSIAETLKEFDSSGSYVIPPGAKVLRVFLCSGGGGGGGGGKTGGTTNIWGGGGGAAGGSILQDVRVEDLGGPGTILQITIGAGGAGGTGATSNATGSNGSASSASFITVNGLPGFLMSTPAANGGSGGSTSAGAGGNATTQWRFECAAFSTGVGGAAGGNGTGSGTTVQHSSTAGGCGGGGGSTSAGNGGNPILAATNSGTPSFTTSEFARNTSIYTATGVGGNGANSTKQINGKFSMGIPAQGGGGAVSGSVAGTGGNGYRGGGGGGGGGGNGGANGANGGAGGNGYCVIAIME